MSKPREWKILKWARIGDEFINGPDTNENEHVHVIEYSAYEALRKERDELELALECVSGAYQVSDLIKERDELYEALEELKMCGPDDGVWERADAVLEKYKK